MKRTPTKHPEIVLYENGKYYYRAGKKFLALGTSDYDEAVKLYDKLMVTVKPSDFRNLGTVLDVYVDFRKNKYLGKLPRERKDRFRTYQEIEGVTRIHLKPAFGDLYLGEFDSIDWENYCTNSKVSDLTNHRKVMTGFLKWCKRKGHLKHLPDISWIPEHKKRKRRIISKEEMIEIFNNVESSSLLLFLSFIAFMGMRRNEVITLRWEDIDFENASVNIRAEIAKTESSARHIPINRDVLKQLIKRKNAFATNLRYSRSQWVFPNLADVRRHMSPSGFKRPWARLLDRTKIADKDITFHDFRATYETATNKRTEFTDTQKEKMAGASIQVQKALYVGMRADDLRGLEDVIQIPKLTEIVAEKTENTATFQENKTKKLKRLKSNDGDKSL